jgi:hypothetical protein
MTGFPWLCPPQIPRILRSDMPPPDHDNVESSALTLHRELGRRLSHGISAGDINELPEYDVIAAFTVNRGG